jgi:hypothetical protein
MLQVSFQVAVHLQHGGMVMLTDITEIDKLWFMLPFHHAVRAEIKSTVYCIFVQSVYFLVPLIHSFIHTVCPIRLHFTKILLEYGDKQGFIIYKLNIKAIPPFSLLLFHFKAKVTNYTSILNP